MSTSAAWNGKFTASACGQEKTKKPKKSSMALYWVSAAPTSEVRISCSQLVMGFGLYWPGDEETAATYTKSRVEGQSEHGLKREFKNKKKDLAGIAIDKETFTEEERPGSKETTQHHKPSIQSCDTVVC
ncbi:hypothetical protein JCM33374_g1917 [Metschnikowia sp. JCM 33374]|nr:hypothetical protein JCM33374_g1917 [Metschnikowia sp. JCM 33374]